MSREKDGEDPAPQVAHLRRAVVIGTTGAGKTTLARELAHSLGAVHIEFDAYRHGPNWTETPDDEFIRRLAHALSGERWVADGNYNVTRATVWPRATAIVWLDLPFGLVFWRLLLRTLRRGIFRETLWNGNKESLLSNFFTRHSLFLWAFNSHWRRRRTLPPVLAEPQYAHLRVVRLRSRRAAARWLDGVRRASTVPSPVMTCDAN